ncbi:adenylyltransferase/cytidyltransferase family protein [Actinoplanes sp. NPDC051851]|uniref:adenylyltransferase/cytidyltransferase family protein n=1 Tax=Actinoplanes sp. NPDC051851 TaxID=3154753 RepID=UPI003436AAA3
MTESLPRWPILGGRWQPFHLGHLSVLQMLLETNPRVIVAVVNPDPLNPFDRSFDRFRLEDNPLNYWERTWLFSRIGLDEHQLGRVHIVPTWHPRASVERESYYLPPQRHRYWYVPALEDSESAKASDMRRLGETIVLADDIPMGLEFRSSLIRAKIRRGQDVSTTVPAGTAEVFAATETVGQQWFPSLAREFAMLVGRFQPFHRGHAWALQWAAERYEHVVIAVRVPEPPRTAGDDPQHDDAHGAHNPLTYWQRMLAISATVNDLGLTQSTTVAPCWPPLWQVAGEEAFLPRKRVWLLPDANGTGVELTAGLRSSGEDCIRVPVPQELTHISGALVRRLASRGDNAWKDLVPSSAVIALEEMHFPDLARASAAKWPKFVESYLDSKQQATVLFQGSGVGQAGAPTAAVLAVMLARVEDLLAYSTEHVATRERLLERLPQAGVGLEELQLWRARRSRLIALGARVRQASARIGRSELLNMLDLVNSAGREILADAWDPIDTVGESPA